MTSVAIVFFSGYGHTTKLAQSVEKGVNAVEGVEAVILQIDQNGDLPTGAWESIQAASAVIYGSPTYMGGPAWQFKKFADATSKPWMGQNWKDKVAAGFTTSASVNGDKFSTIQYLWTLSQQFG